MKIWLRRIALSLLVLAGIYWVSVNLVLGLPHTRDAVNAIQPDQFSVDWHHAWSWYPLRVEVIGLAADGQTPVEQWQLDAERAAVSISLLPLLRGEILVHDLDLEHIDLRLRPRPTKDASTDVKHDLSPFFPVIRNRDPSALAEAVPEPSDSRLVLEIDDIHVRGQHAFWVSHIRGRLPGEVRGSFRMDTESSALSLADGALDLSLQSLRVADRTPVTEAAALRGTIDIPAFRLSETEGLEFLRIATLDAEVDLPVDNLDFLALVLPGLEPLELEGEGRLNGRVRMAGGEVLGGTDLAIEASALAMTFGNVHFTGDGLLDMRVDPDNESEADLIVRFERVLAELRAEEGSPQQTYPKLFTGSGLTAKLHVSETDPSTTSTATKVEELANEVELGFSLEVPRMRVDDLSVYNRLIPEAWDLSLLGGAGTLHAQVEITPDTMSLSLDLASDEADLRYADYHATTDLLLALRARVDAAARPTLHLEGTRLTLSDAELSQSHAAAADPWEAELVVNGGTLSLPGSDADSGPIPQIASQLAERGFGALLSEADGELAAVLTVSELDWIPALLNRPLGLTLDGTAEIDAALHLQDGLLAAGSRFEIPPEQLSLSLLEHRIDGRGDASLLIEHGGSSPSVRLSIELDDGRIRRREEPEPSIGSARLDAVIVVDELGTKATETARVDLALHSAEVQDMAVYNAYLPENAPVSLLGGAAKLVGNLELTDDSATGNLLLTTDDISIALDKQNVTGDLQLDVLVHDGAPNEMRFDITGSSLRFDKFRVSGAAGSDQRAHWHARLQLEETEIVWDKPMQLRMQADISVQDTRPFVAMLDNLHGKPSWFGKLLTDENLAGHLRLKIEDQHAVIEDAMISSPKMGVHAKGIASADAREAMLLLRWHNLTGAVTMHDNKKAFRLTNAPSHFDAYQPGKTSLAAFTESVTEHDASAAHANQAREPTAKKQAPAHRYPSRTVKQGNPFLNEDL